MDFDLSWIIEKVAIPAASAIGGGLLVGRQARRSFHAAKLSEEEATAYRAVLADLKLLRVSAAYSLSLLHRSWEWPEVQESAAEEQKAEEFRIAKTEAFERLREVVALGPVELSPGAVSVIEAFLAEHDSPDRSDSDGIYYEENYWTKQYLRDFVERRKVPHPPGGAFSPQVGEGTGAGDSAVSRRSPAKRNVGAHRSSRPQLVMNGLGRVHPDVHAWAGREAAAHRSMASAEMINSAPGWPRSVTITVTVPAFGTGRIWKVTTLALAMGTTVGDAPPAS